MSSYSKKLGLKGVKLIGIQFCKQAKVKGMYEVIKVGLVEDQALFRQGIKAIIEQWENCVVTFESPDGYSVIERLEKANELPEVMLVDFNLPKNGYREFSGLDVLMELSINYSDIKVIILSVIDDSYIIAQCIEMGASGYLLKDSDPEEVHEAIEAVHARGSYINADALKAIQGKMAGKVKKPTNEELTSREIEVLELVCQQMTADQIGDKLFISPKTVNGHKNNLLQKTGSKNMAGLVMYAVKNGIVKA